jgi:hypothetical protein
VASVPIRSTAVTAAPKDYAIPPSQEIILLSVTAEFIDNGAAGDWLPAVVILDNNGNALCRAVDQGVKVTAGGDAEVSWFPGVKHAAASAASTAIDWAQGRLIAASGDPHQTITSGGVTAIGYPHVLTGGGGAFTWATSVVANDLLQLNKAGAYIITGAAQWDGANFNRRAVVSNPINGSLHGLTQASAFTTANPTGLGEYWTWDETGDIVTGVPTTRSLLAFQNSGVNHQVFNATLFAFYLGAAA